MLIDNVAQYLYPALSWRHRKPSWWARADPGGHPLGFRSEVNTHEKLCQQTFEQKHLKPSSCVSLASSVSTHGQGVLQVDDFVVASFTLPAGQGQGCRGRLLEMVADNSQTFVQVLFDACMSFPQPWHNDCGCQTALSGIRRSPCQNWSSASFFSAHILSKIPYNNAKVSTYFEACWFNV